MLNKKQSRLRRAAKTRHSIKKFDVPRLSVHKTSQHIYAQLTSPDGSEIFVAVSSLSKQLRSSVAKVKGVDAAKVVGKDFAKQAIAKGYKKVAFDRSGFKYHGRIKALADGAREEGLEF
jgi:large subunit ribosomal protein L18